MEQLNSIIKEYLEKKKTDYALMISGDWGSGKTYYFKNEFGNFVKQIKSSKKAKSEKKAIFKFLNSNCELEYLDYEPVFISLFGLSSEEDFQYRVFLGVNPWATSKYLRLFGNISSKVAGVFGVSFEKNEFELLNSFNSITDNNVLVFDDFERINITPKEAFGLINSYSENGYKTIVVCNENAFVVNDKDRDNDYFTYKEKTVRYTFEFKVNVDSVFDSIVCNLDDSNYTNFLKEFKVLLLNLFELGGKRNLRTLYYIIDSLLLIYKSVPSENKYKNEILRRLVISFSIYAFEYKKGIDTEKLKQIGNNNWSIDLDSFWSNKSSSNEDKEEEDVPIDTSLSELYGDFYKEMIFDNCIIEFLLSGYLDPCQIQNIVNNLETELKNLEIDPALKLYKKLSAFSKIDDVTLAEDLQQLIVYVETDKYKIVDLLNVYGLLLQYVYFEVDGVQMNNEITQKFINSIDRQKTAWMFCPKLECHLLCWDETERDSKNYKLFNHVRKHILEINEDCGIKLNIRKCNEFLDLAEAGDVEMISSYREDKVNKLSISGMDWDRFCSVMESAKNDMACELTLCLSFFIKELSYFKESDKKSIENTLYKWLCEYEQSTDRRVRRHYILKLKDEIGILLEKSTAYLVEE